jgi:hypothetical protein
MNKSINPILAGIALSLVMTTTSVASVEGYALAEITGFQLFVDAGGGAHGAPITNGIDVTVVAPSFSSAASADVDSIPGIVSTTGVGTTTPNPGVGFGVNTAVAYQGGGVVGENVFTNLLAGQPLAHADTTGSGAIIAGLAGVAPPADLHTVSEVDLSTLISVTDGGRADSATTSTASFTVTVVGGAPLSIVGDFLANKTLIADLTSSPPGVAATADTSFNITIDAIDLSTGLSLGQVFNWSPDGLVGGILGGVEYADPFSLNASISGFPGFLSTSTLGPALFSAGFTLLPGIGYTFSSELSTSASAQTIGVIPEPATFVVWGLMAMCSCGVAFRASRAVILSKEAA